MNQPEPAMSTAATIIPSLRVRASGEHAHVGMPRAAADAEPKIELVREGEVVRAIDITCSCGHRFRLLCEYLERS